MRTARFVVALMVMGVALTASYSAQQAKDTRADVALQAAIKIETIDGNLKGAIDAYAKVVATYATNRPVAAQALARMAGCYEKLGATQADEARKAYERLVRDFGDQKDLVAQAQARLVALGGTAAPAGPSNHQVWKASTNTQSPYAVSRDGRYVAYADFNNADLFVHDLVSGVDRQLTKGDTGDRLEGDAVFSRDSTQLAYTWWNEKGDRDELRVVDLRGSGIPQSRVLVGNGSYTWPADWTPDGKWIVANVRGSGADQIGLISVDDGSWRMFKSIDRNASVVGQVCLSLDGKYVAYDLAPRRPVNGEHDIFVLPIDGGQEIPAVVDSRADDKLVGWAPEGTRLVFTSDRAGSNSVYTLPVRDGRPQGAPELVRPDIGQSWMLGLSPSGSLYSVVRAGNTSTTSGDMKIASFDFNTGRILSPPTDFVREYFVGRNFYPHWSPDGKSIAYVSRPQMGSSSGPSLVIRSLETDRIVQELHPGLSTLSLLAWTPDGGSFVVVGTGPDGRRGLFRVDRATGDVTTIVFDDPGTTGCGPGNFISYWSNFWSRDGKSIHLVRRLPGCTEVALVERDLTSGVEREIFRGPGDAWSALNPVLSPDGEKVYHRRLIPGGSTGAFQEVAFVERDSSSGSERELARGALGSVGLSPDGRHIATGRNDASTKSRSIELIPVAGGPTRELVRVDLPQSVIDGTTAQFNSLGVYLWAPDSRSLLFEKNFQGRPGELWWVSVDGRDAPKLVNLPKDGDFRVHPDGRRIALTVRPDPTTRQLAEVWVLENFLPKAPSTVKK